MTDRHPDGWQLPSRAPQHAAPFSISDPARRRAHRALRLFVTTGLWAAGLCLVVGSIVLVATTAAPGDSASHATAAAAEHSTALTVTKQGYRISTGAPRNEVIARFAGRGNLTTARFRVRASARWQLRWSYRCPAAATSSGLVVVQNARLAGQTGQSATINWTGPAGAGESWLNPSATSHDLVVVSTCSWTLRVLQPR